MRTPFAILFLWISLACIQLHAQVINTVAGNGSVGYSGDGGPATAAEIEWAGFLETDTARNLYIVSDRHYIRKVNNAGIISTFAGSTTFGFSGDGGPATGALFNGIAGVATDTAGNVYVCDGINSRIRKVNAAGIVQTIAGSGAGGYSGDGGPATAAQIGQPRGIALDISGNIYFDDYYNRIRRISPTGIITTIAGTGTNGFSGDGGAATAAQIGACNSIATDAAGNLYLAFPYQKRVRKINASGIISTYAGTGSLGYSGDGGPATAANLDECYVVATDALSNVYISSLTNHTVRKVNSAGIISTVAGTGTRGFSGDGGPATAAQLAMPHGLATDADGNLYIGESGAGRVRFVYNNNRAPSFTGGSSQSLNVCQNSTSNGISSSLAITDLDLYQSETWSLLSGPSHGTASVSCSGISGGGAVITPIGPTYTPATGYTGNDTFKVEVSDGYLSDTIVLYMHILPLPASITGTANVCPGNTTMLSNATTGGAWSASNTNAAVGSTGIVTGITAGIDTIFYTLPTGCFVTKAVTVNPLPIIGFAGPSVICVSSATSLTSSPGGVWSSGSTGTATVGSSTGVVTGVSSGVVNITYTLPTGCVSSVPVTVLVSPAAITGTMSVCPGSTTALSTTTAGGVWTSGATGIATVSGGSASLTATIGGVSTGTAAIIYTLPTGCMRAVTVTVNSPTAITGTPAACAGGGTTILTNGTPGGTWLSRDMAVATVSGGGTSTTVTGVGAGSAYIIYQTGAGCADSALVTINPLPAAISGSPVVCVATTVPVSTTTAGGTWYSGNMAVADIIGSGTAVNVIGIATGTATITYMLPTGCYVTHAVTVNNAPGTITGPVAVCEASTITLGNSVGGGVWSSSAAGTAAVGSSSTVLTMTVTGVAAGSAIITYSMGPGCFVTKTITVNPLPAAITGAGVVCRGSSVTLGSSGGGTWSSSNTSAAPIGATTGTVTGGAVSVPTAVTITYTLPSTCTTTAGLTVNPLPAGITGSGSGSVCAGSSTTLSTTTTGGTWSSSATGTATVGSGSAGLTMTITGAAAGTATISYTLPTGCYATKDITVNTSPTPILGAATVCAGATAGQSASPPGGVWSRSNTNVTVNSSSGAVTGVTFGTATITYTLPSGCYSTRTITVTASGGSITGAGAVCVGSSTTLTGSGGIGTWSSSGGIATLSGSTGTGVTVTGVSAGVVNISYTLSGGCTSVKTITINALPAVYGVSGGGSYCAGGAGRHVGLAGSAAGVNYQLHNGSVPAGAAVSGAGGSLDFGLVTAAGVYTVTATDATTGCSAAMSGSAAITINPLPGIITGAGAVCAGATTPLSSSSAGGTWSSSNPLVAAIGSSSGVVTGVAIGVADITYTLPTGCAVARPVTVSSAPTAITGAATVCEGSGSMSTVTLTSTPSGGLWSSSNTARAVVNSTSGEVSGVSAGVVTISYSLGTGCTVTKAMTVNASPAAITGTMSVCAGATTTLSSATSGGAWSSSGAVATVSSGSTGLTMTVTGVAPGTEAIVYTAGGCSTTAMVTVNAVPSAIGGPATVCTGASATETNTVAGGVWSTTSANISMGSGGSVTGVLAGTATITYSLGSCAVTRTITVNATLSISGAGGLCVGATTTLTAGFGTWSSGAAGTATVGAATGLVTGINAGVAPITFTTTAGCASVKMVTVYAVPAAISGTAAVCVGGTATLTTTTGGGTWSSGSTVTVTINPTTGSYTGISAGVATISYSLGTGCATTRQVTVNALPAVITGTAVLCIGNATTLSSGTSGGVWSSDNTAVAGIGSATGIVSGAGTGTAMISYTNPVTGCASTRTVTVTSLPAPISGAGGVCLNDSITLSNTTAGGAWSSSNPVLASVGATTGVVSGLVTGAVTITYSLGAGCEVTKAVTVNPLPAGITGSRNLCLGAMTTLATTSAGGAWSSASATASAGSATGVVTGVAGGPATISYTIPTGCAATYTMSVIAVPAIDNIHSVCAWGDTIMVHNANPAGTYSSTSVTVTNLGGGDAIVTGFAPGTGTVTYTLTGLGCASMSLVTVNPLPMAISGALNICRGGSTTLTDLTTGGVWSSSNTAVAVIGSTSGVMSALAGGTSVVAYTLPTGCKEDTVITVSIPPVAGSITGADSWCAGTTGTLTATGGMSGGVWGSSNAVVATVGGSVGLTMTVNALTAGTSTIGYMVSNVCGTDVADKVITVNATPTAGVIEGTDSVCVGAIVMLTDTAAGGVWSVAIGNAVVGSATGKVSGISGGMDTVYYTVTNGGCTARAMLPVRVIPLSECRALGVAGSEPNGIRIYPNPNSGEFLVSGHLPINDGSVILSITNMLGQVVYRSGVMVTNGTLSTTVQLGECARGLYRLSVAGAGVNYAAIVVVGK